MRVRTAPPVRHDGAESSRSAHPSCRRGGGHRCPARRGGTARPPRPTADRLDRRWCGSPDRGGVPDGRVSRHSSIPGPDAPTFRHVLEVDLVAQGVRSVLPGGAATSAGLRISLLQRFDVPVRVAASAATTGVVVSNIVLGAVFLSGVATTAWHGRPSPGLAILVGVVLLLAVAAGLGGTTVARRPDRVKKCAMRLTAPVR